MNNADNVRIYTKLKEMYSMQKIQTIFATKAIYRIIRRL